MVALKSAVSTMVKTSQAKSYQMILPIDLTTVFTGYGFLPAVVRIEDQVGDWDAPGQTRTVYLADGSTAKEKLTQCTFPESFSYTISFTGILGLLTNSVSGQWRFESLSPGLTRIEWQYYFYCRSVFSAPPLLIIAKILWRGYMQKALSLSKSMLEKK